MSASRAVCHSSRRPSVTTGPYWSTPHMLRDIVTCWCAPVLCAHCLSSPSLALMLMQYRLRGVEEVFQQAGEFVDAPVTKPSLAKSVPVRCASVLLLPHPARLILFVSPCVRRRRCLAGVMAPCSPLPSRRVWAHLSALPTRVLRCERSSSFPLLVYLFCLCCT